MSDGLTGEQQTAIETLDADVCVSAGAGSGKTRVLVERFLRLALGEGAEGRGQRTDNPSGSPEPVVTHAPPRPLTPDPCPLSPAVDQILAITFTRKAALEMKERIARALVARGRVEERRRLEVGYISTIHTFCERVLRENPFEAGLDPDFTVLDEAEAALLLDQAYEQVLETAFTRERDPVADLAHACYDRRTRDGGDGVVLLRQNAIQHLNALSSLGWSPEEVAAWAAEPLDRFMDRSLVLLIQELNPVIDAFRNAGAVLAGLSLGAGAMEENRAQFVAGAAALAPLDDLAASSDGQRVAEALAAVEAQVQRLTGLRGFLKATSLPRGVDPEAYGTARDQFSAAKEAYAGVEKWATGWSADGERRSQALARAGLELLARLWHGYERLKRDHAVLDFGDLQRLTRDLLRDSPAVRDRLRARLKYLMVDEFQDTDRLQIQLLDALRGARNLFFVGDGRQSIYRFRHADVRLFREREQALREAEVRDPAAARRLALATNFRSRPEILAFVNGLFAHLWGSGDPAPSSSRAYEPLAAGRAFDPKSASCIDLLPVSGDGGIDAIRRAEGSLVARRVRELLAGGAAITRSDHPERGRPCRASDVVLLLRSMAVAPIYEQTLAEVGLPAFVVGGRNYYARREIRDVVNLLKTIGRPLDDLAVASTLRSPFVGISLDTLALISLQARSPSDKHRSLYGAIGPALDTQPIEADDSARLRSFTALVERIREQENRFRVGQILEITLAETDYALEVLHRPGGRRTLANVRKLLQLANARSAGSVPEFVERIEALTRVSEREGDAPTHAEADNVVRLMSIHQAKGLEFPIVVLPDLGRSAPPSTQPLLALDPDHRMAACRVGERSGCDPLLHHALAAADSAEDREESLRLLYVALTRAEEHLILAGPRPARAGTWAALLWPHLPPDAPDRGPVTLFEDTVSAALVTADL